MIRRANALIAVCLLLASGCSTSSTATQPLNLVGPVDVAFACRGDLRLDPNTVITSAQPLESCAQWVTGTAPTGQEDVFAPLLYGFALQESSGSVAVVSVPTSNFVPSLFSVVDANPLAPGKSSIPVGSLPRGLATDDSGCHVSIANAGTCDVSVLDVNSAIDIRELPSLRRQTITNGTGADFFAVPYALEKLPADNPTIGQECPADPQGVMYVAYPECHMVAAIDMATSQIVDSVQFDAAGVATVTGADVSCHNSCAEGDLPLVADASRPVDISVASDGSRLAIAAENLSAATVIDLDASGLFTTVTQVPLEGSVGLEKVALSDVYPMGGDIGVIGGTAGDFQFVYGVATDGTIRVADVLNANVECDTQIDPRYVATETDVTLLSCFPVGDPQNPPRRVGAKSPGIHLPLRALPTDVEFSTVPGSSGGSEIAPERMIGHFAFATTANGLVITINVDDDNYPDVEDPANPLEVSMVLAMAHQVRDFLGNRDELSVLVSQGGEKVCTQPLQAEAQYGPHLSDQGVTKVFRSGFVSSEKTHLLPTIRSELCVSNADGTTFQTPVSELSFMASPEVRESAYPDWFALPGQQSWSIAWEGPLSLDTSASDVDGPLVRTGQIDSANGTLTVTDPSNALCEVGVEPFDRAIIVGCDPSQGNAQCGLGEVCFVAANSALGFGICLPEERATELGSQCGAFLSSRREFSVANVQAGTLVLGERRRTLWASPKGGCTSDQQCETAYNIQRGLPLPEDPSSLTLPADEPVYSWTCAPDPTRAGAQARCQMTCMADEDCEFGYVCSSGFCVSGQVPDDECFAGVQYFQLQASDAFTVIGTSDGYIHKWIKDPNSDQCIADPNAGSLQTGRIPLEVPPCVGDGPTDITENPCSTTIEQVETAPIFASGCESTASEITSRTVEAIRFENPGMRLHLVDIFTQGDGQCNGDRAGTADEFNALHPGYSLDFTITAGFVPLFTGGDSVFPVTIRKGPTGGMWVMDQGQQFVDFITVRGQVLWFSPADIGGPNAVLR